MDFPALIAQAGRATLEHLGGPITYETSVGEVIALRGVFTRPYLSVDAGGEAAVGSSSPTVFLQISDLVSADGRAIDPDEGGARVQHGGIWYRVRSVQKDGMGGVRLLLHEEG